MTASPFTARSISENKVEFRSDTQEVMDREIAYAKAGGLDFWAFDYYHPQAWPTADKHNYGLKLYLASKHKSDIHFSLIVFPLGKHLGPPKEWPQTTASLIKFFKEPTYQKVLGGRPLLFFYSLDQMVKTFGSEAAARSALMTLRAESVKQGAGDPYFVAQVWSGPEGAGYVDKFGFDAIGAYAYTEGGKKEAGFPYADLARATRKFREDCKATGKKVVPLVSVGWDNRPLRGRKDLYMPPPYGPWYEQATPKEIEEETRVAIQWCRVNPAIAESNTILIYAWNETEEGGWLHPTLKEGPARLDAIRRARH